MVLRQVDSAVDKAKLALQRNQQQVARGVDSAVDNAKVALQRDRQKAQQQVDTAVESAKSALHSLTGSGPVAAHDTPGARLEAAWRAHPVTARQPLRLADAQRLLAAGKLDSAIQALYQLRRQSPRNADVPLLLGHAYFAKRWRIDGLREYDEALRLRPSLRGNAQLVRNVVAALDDPTFNQANALVHARLGKAVLGELRRAGRAAKNLRVQKRAAHLAVELADAGRPHR
jgi:tetratricopeptide (TPR) repeat protein